MCGLLKSNTLWAGFAAGPRRVLRAAAFFGASPVVASALDLHSGATPAENHYLSRGGKPLARSFTFLNDPTEPISVMLLNDLTGAVIFAIVFFHFTSVNFTNANKLAQ